MLRIRCATWIYGARASASLSDYRGWSSSNLDGTASSALVGLCGVD